jgi:hypothetical protein
MPELRKEKQKIEMRNLKFIKNLIALLNFPYKQLQQG